MSSVSIVQFRMEPDFLSGNDHMPVSLGRVPCAENESVGLIHGKQCLHFLLLILASQIMLQTMSDSFVPQEVISYDIPLERVLYDS